MTLYPRHFLAIALCLLGVNRASAQERIELFTSFSGTDASVIEIDATVSGFGTVRRVSPTLNAFYRPQFALAGGRYIVTIGPSPTQDWDFVVFDRRTRKAFNAGFPTTSTAYPAQLVVDPIRPRVFFATTSFDSSGAGVTTLWVLDGATGRARSLTTLPIVGSVAYAPDVDALVASSNLDGVFTIHAVDVGTGAVLTRFAAGTVVFSLTTDRTASRLWAWTRDGLVLYDAAAGRELRRSAAIVIRPTFSFSSPVRDDSRRLILGLDFNEEFVLTLDDESLAVTSRTRVDTTANQPWIRSEKSVLPGRWMTAAYVTRTEIRSADAVCNGIYVDAIDPGGGRRATADVLAASGKSGVSCSTRAVLVRSPFAPASLSASVVGSTVRLAWSDPTDTTEFELEYGVSPGQRAGSVRVGTLTSLTVPGVPPGTYYVRVKALNEVGVSPPSNEVRVVVP